MWAQPLLNAAEVALKLLLLNLNRRVFSGALRRSRERTGLGSCFAVRNFHKGCGCYYLWFYYLCFNYLSVLVFRRNEVLSVLVFRRNEADLSLGV